MVREPIVLYRYVRSYTNDEGNKDEGEDYRNDPEMISSS